MTLIHAMQIANQIDLQAFCEARVYGIDVQVFTVLFKNEKRNECKNVTEISDLLGWRLELA